MSDIVALLILLTTVALCILLISRGRGKQNIKLVSLEIKPPPGSYALNIDNDISLAAVYPLLNQLIMRDRGKLFRRKINVFLVVVFNSEHGTSFVISVPFKYAELVRNQLLAISSRIVVSDAVLPNLIKLKRGSTYHIAQWKPGLEFKTKVEDCNLVEDLAINLHGLRKNELAAWQICLKPNSVNLIIIFKTIGKVLRISLNTVEELIETDQHKSMQRKQNRQIVNKSKNYRNSSSVFKVNLRSMVEAKDEARLETINTAVRAAAEGIGLIEKLSIRQPKLMHAFLCRNKGSHYFALSNLDFAPVLFNFPQSSDIWEEQARLNMGKLLRSGLDYSKKPDVVLGSVEDQVVGLSVRERQTHTLVLGGTGMGKSTLLGYSFVQDMANKKGALILDPHGDLADLILRYVPPHRVNDVIYIDPVQVHYPVSLNLMEIPKGLNADELVISKDFIAESVISIFRKIFSEDDSGGHRIEYMLRNAIYTAFNIPGATLFTLQKLFTNDVYRAGVIASLNDDSLKDFWYSEYAKAGSFQRVKMISGVTAKLGRFERSAVVHRMLSSPNSTINFDKLIDEHKIIICNFAKGSIGEDNASLLGMIVLAKLQLAALRRVLKPNKERAPFYLYVDEFQLFNTPIFTQLISESRKFGIYLTLAEQTTAHQDEREINILLANVGNIITFRSAAEIDKKRLLPLFSPYLTGLDLNNLEPYNCYLRSSGEQSKRPVSFKTIKLSSRGSDAIADKVIKHSRLLYTRPYLNNNNVSNKNGFVPMTKTS